MQIDKIEIRANDENQIEISEQTDLYIKMTLQRNEKSAVIYLKTKDFIKIIGDYLDNDTIVNMDIKNKMGGTKREWVESQFGTCELRYLGGD